MHIELLWLIPVLAFAGVLFFIATTLQRQSALRSRKGTDLSKEVAAFNAGHQLPAKSADSSQDDRLRELEKAINIIAGSLSAREQQLPDRTSGTASSQEEIDGLKEKLRNVFKEYDILLSETYSLRAKVKQLLRQAEPQDERAGKVAPIDSILTGPKSSVKAQAKPELHLYGDTRIMKAIDLERDGDADFNGRGSSKAG